MNVGQINQAKLAGALHAIFPSESVIKNARKEAAIKSPVNGKYLEVDLWYPNLRLCFEYQDEYHYHSTWYCQIPLSLIQERDGLKRDMLLSRGDTLILVPCWWDGTTSSLQATINFHRPELFPASPSRNIIPENPSHDFFPATIVPKNNTLQLMLASFPNQQEFEVSCDQPWWLGEKYDGVRCYWNPSEKQMYSRHGFMLDIHPRSQPLFGSVFFDAELWSGRGLFIESQKLVNALYDRIDWSLLRVVCFDEASNEMSASGFESRYHTLLSQFHPDHPIVKVASRMLCSSPTLLAACLHTVVTEGGGEGVIMRKPLSIYERGRSDSLVKMKASKADQEALVVSVEENGSILLQLPDGTRFVVEKEDCVLHRRPVRGDIVTFTHDFTTRQSTQDSATHSDEYAETTQEFSADAHERNAYAAPANPVVFRVREDLSWDDVLRNSPLLPVRHFSNDAHMKIEATTRPRGYWIYDKGKHMRAHLETIAREHGIDPLVAEDWYHVSRQEFMQHREVRTLILHYGNSLVKAVVDLFPELNLDVSKFVSTPMGYWVESKNRRNFYEEFARSRGADPLDPQFWYNLSATEGLSIKGSHSLILYHNNSVIQPLLDLFPEVEFDTDKFYQSPLLEHVNRRKFFEKYAQDKGFDPHNVHNWYTQRLRNMMKHKGTFAVVAYHNNSITQALRDVFPELSWGKFNFSKI